MDQADIPSLLARLASDEDGVRKMAVFKLQSSINDPGFADVFISSGGLVALRQLIMTASGNTLAYSLQSLTRLLEVDMGWEVFCGPAAIHLVDRVVELIVTNPLVNILRGAMSILVALVSHSTSSGRPVAREGGLSVATASTVAATAAATETETATPATRTIPNSASLGFNAIKPVIAMHPQFFELVIQQLQSADHALSANALTLINALIRDSIYGDATAAAPPVTSPVSPTATAAEAMPSTPSGEEWTKFIKRLQDLGLIKAVYGVMQSPALHQDLALPLLEFQNLTKLLISKWRDDRFDLERPEHRRVLKGLHLASAPEKANNSSNGTPTSAHFNKSKPAPSGGASPGGAGEIASGEDKVNRRGNMRHNPEKWRRLGFETESPTHEFSATGYLGMMDLADFVRKDEDGFQKLLIEQSSRPLYDRCPVARASLAVTLVLYEHFDVDGSEGEDVKGASSFHQSVDHGAKNYDRLLRPLLLQWSRLHTGGLRAFFRLWKATGANCGDLAKVTDLVRVLVEQAVGQATRTKDVLEVEDEMQELELGRLRDLQVDLLDQSFENRWGTHLHQVRDELRQEALHFVKEQRVRCLLQGSWFARHPRRRDTDVSGDVPLRGYVDMPWRFAKLSHNRRFLHYADFLDRSTAAQDPGLDSLPEKIDLGTISSVVSNVLAAPTTAKPGSSGEDVRSLADTLTRHGQNAPQQMLQSQSMPQPAARGSTKVTIFSYISSASNKGRVPAASPLSDDEDAHDDTREQAILTLYPASHSLASEWLDGLLMLLGQTPITAETNKLVNLVQEYGLRIRLLNVRVDAAHAGKPASSVRVPSREGLDDDYYYEI